MKGLEINGYFTIVENEILDLLLILKLTKHEIKIMLAGVRVLNGFDKEKDRIPLSFLTKITRMDKGDCSRTVKSLIKKKMLYKNEGEIGINRDFRQWNGVGDLPTGKGLVKWLKWVGDSYKKGVGDSDTSKQKEKQNSKQRGVGLKKLSIKEADKLEGKKWLKQVMWQREKFSERFIDEIFKIYSFMQCYNTYLAYQDAHNIRDKEAWVLAKLRRGPEPEE